MTKQVSKEYIQAMNGILNGEKWCRNCWSNRTSWKYGHMPFIRKDHDLIKYVETDGRGFDKKTSTIEFKLSPEDIQATDWERVDDKTN